MNNTKITAILLRTGLAFVFLYAAISSLQYPLEWAGFLPSFLTNSFSATVLIKLVAIYEFLLTAWLVSDRFIKYCALLCTITLLGIVAVNLSSLITTFRDVGLAFMGLALYFVSQDKIEKK